MFSSSISLLSPNGLTYGYTWPRSYFSSCDWIPYWWCRLFCCTLQFARQTVFNSIVYSAFRYRTLLSVTAERTLSRWWRNQWQGLIILPRRCRMIWKGKGLHSRHVKLTLESFLQTIIWSLNLKASEFLTVITLEWKTVYFHACGYGRGMRLSEQLCGRR